MVSGHQLRSLCQRTLLSWHAVNLVELDLPSARSYVLLILLTHLLPRWRGCTCSPCSGSARFICIASVLVKNSLDSALGNDLPAGRVSRDQVRQGRGGKLSNQVFDLLHPGRAVISRGVLHRVLKMGPDLHIGRGCRSIIGSVQAGG